MDQQIWQWTLTKDAIAPCFVRDVLEMRQPTNPDYDFFWLGYTPCRTVLLVGMVVAVQNYDKRAIYTIDDGTAVIDCVLRHPPPTLHTQPPLRSIRGPSTNPNIQRPSPKKQRVDKSKALESMGPPPPITEPGYPVRVVGRVSRHYQSKQIHADSIGLCPSSLDEIAHLGRVIDLHKTKYSLAVPFVPPPEPTSSAASSDTPAPRVGADAGANVFSNTSLSSRPGPSTVPYTLPAPPRISMPLQDRNRPPPLPMQAHSHHGYTHAPSSPTASSIASSTPSSPCKPSSPVKAHESPRKPKLRHPSRLHTCDLTANTFRLYLKHYMDNAPPPFLVPTSRSSPCRNTRIGLVTPTKRTRRPDDDEDNESTPRPCRGIGTGDTSTNDGDNDKQDNEDGPTLGFTLSHLRRVPELALLASRVVRAEQRKREKAERDKERTNTSIAAATSASSRSNGRHRSAPSASGLGSGTVADPPRKKIKRLFSWAVVKLYQEGSIVIWDGDVRPLPAPPPPVPEGSNGKGPDRSENGLWKSADDTRSTLDRPYTSNESASASAFLPASILYTSSASVSLYSHYHAPRRPERDGTGTCARNDVVDADADTGDLSDPPVDEEAYVPLTPRLLAGYVRDTMDRMRRGHRRDDGNRGTGPVPEEILGYMQRSDARWARVGVWAVEEALAVLKAAASR